jgi:hypothetical protein
MIIYHAALCEEEFILWGETPEDQAVPVSLRSARRTAASDIMPLPYSAGIQQIGAGLAGTLSVSNAPQGRGDRRLR